MLLNIIYFIAGLIAILIGANWLVDGAASIAKRFNISNLVIGLTIVAFGTSTPELVISVTSAAQGSTELAIGNVLGSNIFNILGILGIAAIIYPLSINDSTHWKEIPLSLLAAIVLGIMANDITLDNTDANFITRSEGIVLLCFFVIFIYYSIQIAKIRNKDEDDSIKAYRIPKSIFLIVIGLAGLIIGGKFLVDGAIFIANKLGMSEAFIGLTIVAIGSSIPELATSIVAAKKKLADIAVGNIVGSNIFNIFCILGISATIKPLHFNIQANVDILFAIIASVLLFLSSYTIKKKQISRIEGIIYLTVYIGYMIFLITRAKAY